MRVLLSICCALVFFSCKKNSLPSNVPFDYAISGLPDTVWAKQADTVLIPFSIDVLSGTGTVVNLQVSGLPSTMGASFSVDVDTPGFNSVLRVVTNSAEIDTYKIVVRASSVRMAKEDSFFVVVGANPSNPARFIFGSYASVGWCSYTGNNTDTLTISEVVPEFNKLRFRGLWHRDAVLIAEYNPATDSIYIAPQQTVSATIEGFGVVSGTQMSISYAVDFGISQDSCTVVLTKF